MGQKGQVTRLRLMSVVVEILKTTPFRNLKVADIARKASISPSTFYLYFKDVEELVLEVVKSTAKTPPEVLACLDREWTQENCFEQAREFVELYGKYWDEHRDILRLRNAEADRGNENFLEERLKWSQPILDAITKKIEQGQERDAISRQATANAIAAVLLAAIERLSGSYPVYRHEPNTSRPMLIDAQARILAQLIAGNSD